VWTLPHLHVAGLPDIVAGKELNFNLQPFGSNLASEIRSQRGLSAMTAIPPVTKAMRSRRLFLPMLGAPVPKTAAKLLDAVRRASRRSAGG